MAYSYPAMVAWNPGTNTVAKNTIFQAYAPTDTGFTSPLPITDNQGNALLNLNSGTQGIFPSFKQAQYATVVISDTPNHTYSWTVPCSQANPVVPWAANTYFTQGQPVVNPSGDIVTASINHTSTSTYDSTKWNYSTTGKYGTLSEAARRRSYPLNVTPSPVASPAPTATIGKYSGASAIAIATGGTGYAQWDTVTMAGGTYGTPMRAVVTSVSAGAITGVAVDIAGTYTATPANPVAQGSTSGVGTGATFTITWNAASASTISSPVNYGPTSTAFRFTGAGPANENSSGYYGDSVNNATACSWEWVTDANHLDIQLIGLNTKGALYVNGQRIDTAGFSTDATGAPYVYTLDFAGVTQPRTIKILNVNSAFGGVAVPASAKIWAPVEARRPLAYGLGDSYMFGTGATTIADAAFDYMCQFLNLEGLPDGIGGTGWTSTGTNAPASRVQAKLSALTHAPDYVFLDLGYNDAGGDMNALATSFDATVAQIRAIVPSAKIIAFGPATPLGGTTNLSAVKSAVSARCAALNIPFVDVENWVDSNNKVAYTGADNTHPTPAGHAYIGARKAQAVTAYA